MDDRRPHIFIIDEDSSMRLSLRNSLESFDFTVRDFDSPQQALEQIDAVFDGVVLCNVGMSGMDGFNLLREIRDIDRDLPVILISGRSNVSMAVEAMRRGAFDVIEKPFAGDMLRDVLRSALEKRGLALNLRRTRTYPGADRSLGARLVGEHPLMRDLKRKILDVAQTPAPVLLWGETGTGKEIAARCLHDYSPRADRPFVVVDCASIPLTLAESELFGYVKGAFTGAEHNRTGKLEAADGGTLFLDEINSLPYELQGKLLRALQEKFLTPVGATSPRKVDFRLLSSTNEDLRPAIEQRRFRSDLFYRLATVELTLPPLRAHKEDIPLLFNLFLEHAAAVYGREVPRPGHADLALLTAYSWPGNVRELRNIADRYIFSGEKALEALILPASPDAAHHSADAPTLAERIADFERHSISDAIRRHRGDMYAVMHELGLPRRTLNEKMAKLGVSREEALGRKAG
ncbi:MAG: sigma-54 dependent transcriptional regulator [Desulfovibrio sp.]|jgi:two-component system C4-dicarboxylate transport response regulator DctD|nr:sigma-54 dependent transcriptional regulator [Desulfovibrio sp.]